MNLQTTVEHSVRQLSALPACASLDVHRSWYAIFTAPQHEKAVVKQLAMREIETFLPTYETIHIWKNRQKMKLVLPLFPSYAFVHIERAERARVLQSPGVIQLVGNGRESIPLADAEIECLRSALGMHRIEPFRELVVGTRVRIKSGVTQGVEGTLVRKSESMRFVLSLQLINQHAAIHVDAGDLEPVFA